MRNLVSGLFCALFTLVASAKSITMDIPDNVAEETCKRIVSPVITNRISLYQSFDGDIKNFRLYDGKWTPHYDGGYDESQQKWLGYDWVTKRTLPAAREQQIYVDPQYKGSAKQALGLNPFSVVDGRLVITARSIPPNLNSALPGFSFTSGLITTRSSFLQKYGYFEIDAKVPQGAHLLPAFWLLPFDKSWPPEIDVFEAPGHEKDTITTTVHSKDSFGKIYHSGCRLNIQNYDRSFHKYGVLWLPDKLIFFIDRKPVSLVKSPLGFDKPMYMLANLAVGGAWVGFMTNDDGIPVDYVIKDISAYSLKNDFECNLSQGGAKLCQGM